MCIRDRIFHFSRDIVTHISDKRRKPRISTAAVVKSSMVLFWARMGSINAWEQVGRARFWQSWLEEPTFSADTLGRVHALLDTDGLRQGIHDVYQRLKRNKALPDIYGLGVVVLDGHESHASYLRHCPGCLQRTIPCEGGDRIQDVYKRQGLRSSPLVNGSFAALSRNVPARAARRIAVALEVNCISPCT